MNIKLLKYQYISGWQDYPITFKHYGFQGIIDNLRNRSKIQGLTKSSVNSGNSVGNRTSITHVNSYLRICEYAASDLEILNTFRRYAEYQIILDHLSRRNGDLCLSQIISDAKIVENLVSTSRLLPGSPLCYYYQELGAISPTDIRYAKILKDLTTLFSLEGIKNVVEIGVGYGGQAAQIINFMSLDSYTFVDLPEVLQLTEKAISNIESETALNFQSPDSLAPIKSDLLISNYAFSELTKPIQEMYLEKIVRESRRGYMIYNHIHEKKDAAFSAFEITKMIPGSKMLAENPLTFEGNVLIVWGMDIELDERRFSTII